MGGNEEACCQLRLFFFFFYNSIQFMKMDLVFRSHLFDCDMLTTATGLSAQKD